MFNMVVEGCLLLVCVIVFFKVELMGSIFNFIFLLKLKKVKIVKKIVFLEKCVRGYFFIYVDYFVL